MKDFHGFGDPLSRDSLSFVFKDDVYDFTHPTFRFNGTLLRSKGDLCKVFISMLRKFSYPIDLDFAHRLPGCVRNYNFVDYKVLRDCLRQTVKYLSVANDEDLVWLCGQSLYPSGGFCDPLGLPIYRCAVYNGENVLVKECFSSYIEDFRPYLELDLNYYVVIS